MAMATRTELAADTVTATRTVLAVDTVDTVGYGGGYGYNRNLRHEMHEFQEHRGHEFREHHGGYGRR